MADYAISKKSTVKLVEMADVLTVNAPFCRESNKDYEAVERADGYTFLVDPPDVGVVTKGAKIPDEGSMSINRNQQVTITLEQEHTAVMVGVVDNELLFKDNDSVLGLRAQNLASVLHKKVCSSLSYGLTAHVATAGKEMLALAKATSVIRTHRGSDIVGGFNSSAMPALYESASNKFNADEISKAIYKESSIGRFAMANWFETQDLDLYTWTQALTGTVTSASITFDSAGKCASVVIAGTGMGGDVLVGTPFTLGTGATLVKTTDLLQNATANPAVMYVKKATVTATSVTLELMQPLFSVGNRKNVNLSANATGLAINWLLTTTKTYAKAIAYSKITNLYRQANVTSVIGAKVMEVGDGVEDIRLQASADGDIRANTNIMRVDALTGNELAYSQLAHTVFFQLD